MTATTFSILPIGGGGYLVGMSMSADGVTKFVRTDTYGAYRLDSNNIWQQIETEISMPSGFADGGGVYEICAAPSDASISYMMFRGRMYKSTNANSSAMTWTRLTGFTAVTVDSNGTFRYAGRKMAIDPNDPKLVRHQVVSIPAIRLFLPVLALFISLVMALRSEFQQIVVRLGRRQRVDLQQPFTWSQDRME